MAEQPPPPGPDSTATPVSAGPATPDPQDLPADVLNAANMLDAEEALKAIAGNTPIPADGEPALDGDSADGQLPDHAMIEELLKQANFEDPTAATGGMAATGIATPDTEAFKLPNFQQVMADAQVSSIDLLRDVELTVKIELGRSRMLVEDVLKLGEGSVVELDKLAGDPVDVFVNERLVARGEVLVLNDNFCVRVNEIVAGTKEEGL